MAFYKGHQTFPQQRYYDGACFDFRIILELSGAPKQSSTELYWQSVHMGLWLAFREV